MRASRFIGSDALVLIGIALGLVVAVLVDRTMVEGVTDRPVVIAAVTMVVAILWLVVVRLFVGPAAAREVAPKR